jgi:hypothetical protein
VGVIEGRLPTTTRFGRVIGIPDRHFGDANARRRRVSLGQCVTNTEGRVI